MRNCYEQQGSIFLQNTNLLMYQIIKFYIQKLSLHKNGYTITVTYFDDRY